MKEVVVLILVEEGDMDVQEQIVSVNVLEAEPTIQNIMAFIPHKNIKDFVFEPERNYAHYIDERGWDFGFTWYRRSITDTSKILVTSQRKSNHKTEIKEIGQYIPT